MDARSTTPLPSAEKIPEIVPLIGTPFLIIDYRGLLEMVQDLAQRAGTTAIDFCNAQVVTMRRIDPSFIEATKAYDYFVPDGMPLIWCLRAMGVSLRDRVYGPAFMHYAFCYERNLRHYFLGGSEIASKALVEQARLLGDGQFKVVGANHRYYQPSDSDAIIQEINRLSPDVIWVGLGTPKQQQWIHDNKHRLARGLVLTVGFAFDVNAGIKRDAPMWMQKLGITWIFRISQEPSRLLHRYLKYNTLFLGLILFDLTRFVFGSIRRRFSS